MTKSEAKALLESVDETAEALVTAQIGHRDPTDDRASRMYFKIRDELLMDHEPKLDLIEFRELACCKADRRIMATRLLHFSTRGKGYAYTRAQECRVRHSLGVMWPVGTSRRCQGPAFRR